MISEFYTIYTSKRWLVVWDFWTINKFAPENIGFPKLFQRIFQGHWFFRGLDARWLLGCMKNLQNNGINYRAINWLAGVQSSTVSRWWQLKYFFMCTPKIGGRFPFWLICFKWVGEKPPTRYGEIPSTLCVIFVLFNNPHLIILSSEVLRHL